MVITTCLASIMIVVVVLNNATSFVTAVASTLLWNMLESLGANLGTVVLQTTSKTFLFA